MRLTTVARKIDKTPTELVTFLEEKGIELDNGLHSKLESKTLEMVFDHFAPEQSLPSREEAEHEDQDNISKVGELPIEIDTAYGGGEKERVIELDESLPSEETIQEPDADQDLDVKISKKTGTLDDLETLNPEEIGHIKAKKVKLEGIKVVGKIELPEKPVKEVSEVKKDAAEEGALDTISTPGKKTKSTNRKFDRKNRKKSKSRSRKPLTYEEKLKREEREKLKKRRRKENEEKLRKRKYYEKNIRPKTTLNPVKKKKKKQIARQTQPAEKVVLHKNPIKRLWAWLNGKYDRY